MKLLVILFTHDKYSHLIGKIWNRINELEYPEDTKIDKLIITEDTEQNTINYCNKNNLPIKYTNIDINEINDFNINPLYVNQSGFTFETFYRVCKLRDFYLGIAKDSGYDYLLQLDGDVFPPIDGAIKLLKENKKYIGAAVDAKSSGGPYVAPNKTEDGIVYECNILGNCFHVEHRDMFDFNYRIIDNIPPVADSQGRCEDIINSGSKIYCHPLIKCEHLE